MSLTPSEKYSALLDENKRLEQQLQDQNTIYFVNKSNEDMIKKIACIVEEQQKMWKGNGTRETPGLQYMIFDMHRILHGTEDEPGLVKRVVGLEKKENTRVRINTIFATGGAIIGAMLPEGIKKILGL